MTNHLSRIIFIFCLITAICEQTVYSRESNKNTRESIPKGSATILTPTTLVQGDNILISQTSAERRDYPQENINQHNNEDLFESVEKQDNPPTSADSNNNKDLFKTVEEPNHLPTSTNRINPKGSSESPPIAPKTPLAEPNSLPAPKEAESPSEASESSSVKQDFLYEAAPPTQSYIEVLSGTHNNTNIQYFLGKDRQAWKKEEIAKGQVHTVRCREYPFLKVETKINNQTSQKIYQLQCQSRYTFMWNSSHKRWELRKIRDIR
ncbi:hypothetical protein [Acaryochloris sp. IP29b_bin.148]|uniref:hypothetical protein n=1 Tax=Acaryochloris sp. IP29b_bin.148 TaxID=2969218 RepID=UPI002630F110|nr:hypothetical protein [Acaryochloris sp. IP29b_bin.148]